MKHLPQISEAEYEVMKIVWAYAPISTNEITERLVRVSDWSPKTIQTLIKRLVNKGALSYEKEGRVFVYTPLVQEKEYVGEKSRSFLKRFYQGNITAMVSAFLENDALSEDEIDSLRDLLSRKQTGGQTLTDFMLRFLISNLRIVLAFSLPCSCIYPRFSLILD